MDYRALTVRSGPGQVIRRFMFERCRFLRPARRPVKAPPSYNGADTIPGPPTPVAGTLQWLDGDGNVVGPADPELR
jgi:hypothetical protein